MAVARFDGRNGWPAYHHPGGVQLVGDVLAVPLEGPLAVRRYRRTA